ncbi:MAG: helix-turn-helix domain-containing protein [Clostridiales bacterium]|nr:helix-turn-helix domain-containing protein [Clostridiales bacterium]
MSRVQKPVYEYRIYEVTPSNPFVMLSGSNWRISDVLSSRLHFHNCVEIGYCWSDSGFIGLEGGDQIPFRAGDIFIIPRHVPHTTCSARGVRSLWSYLFVDFHALSAIRNERFSCDVEERAIGRCLRVRAEELPRIHFLAKTLLAECESADGEDSRAERDPNVMGEKELARRLYATSLVMELNRLNPAGTELRRVPVGDSFVLKPVLNYIHDHYAEDCGIRELSELCHLSESHFRRLFVQVMGEGPLQFVNRTRIRQACTLLDSTDESVINIAQAVGMYSISSFNRNFHTFTGVSPREYRARRSSIPGSERSVLAFRGWTAAEELPTPGEKREKI